MSLKLWVEEWLTLYLDDDHDDAASLPLLGSQKNSPFIFRYGSDTVTIIVADVLCKRIRMFWNLMVHYVCIEELYYVTKGFFQSVEHRACKANPHRAVDFYVYIRF